MKYKVPQLLVAALAGALPGMASAGKFGWFDEAPLRDTLGQPRTPAALFNRDAQLTFGIDAYESLASSNFGDYDTVARASLGDGTVVHVYGEFSPRASDFHAPLVALNPRMATETGFDSANSRLSGFGVNWQHRVDAFNTFSLSAGYSEVPWSNQTPNLDALDTRASLSWKGTWTGRGLQPGLTGSFFVGDENVRDEAYQQLGRKYYGFSVGGELRLQDHTPYLSYRVRRNIYQPDDMAYLTAPYEDQAQISAGWKWQVQSNWSLQAEARYGLNGAYLDQYSTDRSRIFFGTRFDFR